MENICNNWKNKQISHYMISMKLQKSRLSDIDIRMNKQIHETESRLEIDTFIYFSESFI
jgi:hypothetical protein